MSTLSRLPLALLGVLTLLLVWAGSASADEEPALDLPVETVLDCAATPTAEDCLPLVPGPDPVDTGIPGDDPGTDEQTTDGQPPADDGPETTSSSRALAADPALVLPDCEDPTELLDCLPVCDEAPFDELPICEEPGTGGEDCETDGQTAAAVAPPGMDPCMEPLPTCLTEEQLAELIALLEALDPSELEPVLDLLDSPELEELLEQLDPAQLEELLAPLLCTDEEEEEPTEPAGPQQPVTPGVYYENCSDARAQGVTNIKSTDAGYRPALDGDSDGIGCEQAVVVAAPVSNQTYSTGKLAYTGFELGPQLAAAGVLVLLGAGLLTVARRRA